MTDALIFAAGWAKRRHFFFLHIICFWIKIRHWGTVHAALFVGWMSYLKGASQFLFNLLMWGNWSAEGDSHPMTPCSLHPPCFVTLESECSSTMDAFRDLNENNSNVFGALCSCCVTSLDQWRTMTNCGKCQWEPWHLHGRLARRKWARVGHEGRVFEYDPATKYQN
jgi:hypothetical protein